VKNFAGFNPGKIRGLPFAYEYFPVVENKVTCEEGTTCPASDSQTENFIRQGPWCIYAFESPGVVLTLIH